MYIAWKKQQLSHFLSYVSYTGSLHNVSTFASRTIDKGHVPVGGGRGGYNKAGHWTVVKPLPTPCSKAPLPGVPRDQTQYVKTLAS